MSNILESFGNPLAFRPRSMTEAFALRLACKLGDQNRLFRYLQLSEQQPRAVLVRALHLASSEPSDTALPERFARELSRLTGRKEAL